MPVMKESNVDTAEKKATQYGLSEQSEDDFGHGTKCKSLADSSEGLMLSITYSVETKEILCGTIVTNALASVDQQKTFIKDMSEVLCPLQDAKNVSEWVSSNIGTKNNTTINGIDYKMDLGPVQNALYYAGYDRWESWDLTFQNK